MRFSTCLFLAAAVGPLAAQAAPDAEPLASRVVAGIQSFYQASADFRAEFVQTYTYKIHRRTQVSTGQVLFKKPGRMRWDYRTPVVKLFLSDGKVLWVYEPEESQAFRRSLGSAQLPVALTFMSGEGKLTEAFDAKLLPSAGPDELLLELVPKRDEGEYQSLRLVVDRKTLQVKASTVVDPVGNTNHLEFSKIQTNSGLPDAAFHFVPPEGVRIVDEPKSLRE